MSFIGYEKICDCPADFEHKNGKGQEVPCVEINHYARVCPSPPHSVLLAEALYQDYLSNQVRYGDPDSLSVTSLTGDPLQLWFKRNNTYVEDPLDRRFMLRGTMAHEGFLDRMDSPRFVVEQPMYLEVGGQKLYGRLDAFDLRDNKIIDLKTSSKWRIDKFNKMKTADILKDQFVKMNIYQVNAYRVLVKEMLGLEADKLELQYWDGDLNVVTVPVPVVDYEVMKDRVMEDAEKTFNYLAMDTPDEIPTLDTLKTMVGASWHMVKNSGVWHLVREELERRE